jgi:hypothetical protein
MASPDYADSNLAAVCNQDLLEHCQARPGSDRNQLYKQP